MKKSIIYTAFVFASLCYACTSKKHEVSEAKTTEEAVEAISGNEYQLVKQVINGQEVKSDKPVRLVITKLDDAQFSEDLKAGSTALGIPNKSAMNIITNLKGYENEDANKPYWFYHNYFNSVSQSFIQAVTLKAIPIWVIKQDSLILRSNPKNADIYGSSNYIFIKK
jgi:hypothetical protein